MRISRLLFAAAGLLSAASATAQEAAIRPDYAVTLPSSGLVSTGKMPVWNPAASVAELEYRILDSLANAFSYYTGQQQPLVYDAATGILATIHRGSPAVSGDGNNIYLRLSNDMGRTWSPRIGPLHDPAASASGRYPSLAISNPTNSANPADLIIFYTFPILNGAGGSFGGFASGIVSAATSGVLATVTNTGLDGGTYGSDSKPVITAEGDKAVMVQNMSGDAFAVRIFDFNAGSETASIPAQFAGSVFRPGTADGRYSTTSGLDKDAAGNIYAGFLAYPADFTDATRLRPAVSKSTDNGATWSALEYAPENLLPDFGTALGFPADSAFISYDSDFIVTGPDSYSWVATLVAQDRSREENTTVQHLVEIKRMNGTWSIEQIAEIPPFIVALDGDGSGTLTESQMAHEAQISRTADGSRLVVKYLSFFNYFIDSDFNNDGATPDTTFTTDVMVTSRPTAGGAWTEPGNVTQSVLYDRVTWIPDVLPNDLSDVALLTVQTALNGEEESDSARLIGVQRQLTVQQQYITVSQFDANVTSSVRNNAAVAAKALAIYPNPVGAEARASFSIPSAGTVSVRIHDVTGNEIMSVPARQMAAGAHALPFNTAALNNGVYYYTVTFNGTASTTMFTVTR